MMTEEKFQLCIDAMRRFYRECDDVSAMPHWESINRGMAEFRASHPDAGAPAEKCRLYELLAEYAEPTLFTYHPFFFELKLRFSKNWGVPWPPQPASWLLLNQKPHSETYRENARLLRRFCFGSHDADHPAFWGIYNVEGFDNDHHSPGYGFLFQAGLNGIDRRVQARLEDPALTSGEREELNAMRAGIAAMLRLAERFAQKAGAEAAVCTDPDEQIRLERIARTARRIPAEPPESFYEGLQMLLFVREALADLEGIGISVLGRADLLLAELYRRDLAEGRLQAEEAKELLRHWIMIHDVKCAVADGDWPENSTCIELGGCDADGGEVFNEVTAMIIEVHREQHLITPKLNCRYSAKSDAAYLTLLAKSVLAGGNVFAWLNDDALIPALLRHGKTPAEARNYVNGGCQETICEGVEHSAGGFFYLNLPNLLHEWFCGTAEGALPVLGSRLEEPDNFEAFYRELLAMYRHAIVFATRPAAENGREFRRIQPGPLFSTLLAGCIESARDYTAGGARYNPTGMALCGLPNIVNALSAVRTLVYEEKSLTLAELREALRRNWQGESAALRMRILQLPGYGDNDPRVDALAARFSADLCSIVRACPNERGSSYQAGYFIYWSYKSFGDVTGATPDGRMAGEYFAQGVAPTRNRQPAPLTSVLDSLAAVDWRDAVGNAVLDWQLPAGAGIAPDLVVAVMREAARRKIPTLQPNCVDAAALQDARLHPEAHGDLVVRIAGLSALFIRLKPEVQEEMISRTMYQP